jgi:hypothetical protein
MTLYGLRTTLRVVNFGIPNDFGIPILVNPEGLRDPENQSRNRPGSRDPEKLSIYLVTIVRLPVQNPGRIPGAVIDNPYDALTTVVKLEVDLMSCSALTFVRRTLVSIRFGQQSWGFVSHYHYFLTMCTFCAVSSYHKCDHNSS